MQTWDVRGQKMTKNANVICESSLTVMGCWQCSPLILVELKGKHCGKLHCHNGVVDTFGQWQAEMFP